MQPAILTTQTELRELARRLADQTIIAVDLEADSLHHYRDKVCLLQVSTPEETLLIDPLGCGHLDPLRSVLGNPSIRKLFHAADYDLRCLRRDFDLKVDGLFDTMISAQLLGEEKIGLADLLNKYFNVQLDKRFQRADWSQRPLSSEMIAYAAEDTRHLHRLAELFEQRLRQLGRLSWAEEEFALLEQVSFDTHQGPLWLRFKGANQLDRRQLRVLEVLLQWRETEGERRDRPVFKVIGNQALLEIARSAPQTEQALSSLDGVGELLAQRYGRPLLKCVRRGLDCPESELPSFPQRSRPQRDPLAERDLKALKGWRLKKAAELGIEPGVLINNGVLDELVGSRPQTLSDLELVGGLKSWQCREFGTELVAALAVVTSGA